jgi:hypothetical protein
MGGPAGLDKYTFHPTGLIRQQKISESPEWRTAKVEESISPARGKIIKSGRAIRQ